MSRDASDENSFHGTTELRAGDHAATNGFQGSFIKYFPTNQRGRASFYPD